MVIFLFLTWTLSSVFLTLNVFRPLAKRTNSSFTEILLSFALGWLIGDLLPHWILLNIGITLLFSFSDIFSQPLGWTGLIIHFAGWTILSLRLWIILNLPERLENKMEEQLGNIWHKTSTNFASPAKLINIDWYSWINPNTILNDPRIEIIRDRVFFEQNDIELKLDIYRPRSSKIMRPALLQIHGGAWISGSKRQASLLMTQMAAQGWVCFSLAYRLSPEVVFPEHLIDIKRALKWIKAHADEYGLDPNFIIATGGSAGAHLATLLALTPNQPEFQPEFKQTDTCIQGCVALYGVFDIIEAFEEATLFPAKAKVLKLLCGGTPETQSECYLKLAPKNWIKQEAPPFLLVQGENDALIPVTETDSFFQSLQTQKKSLSALLRLPLVEHAFDIFPTLTAQCIIPIIARYLIMLHKNHINHSGA